MQIKRYHIHKQGSDNDSFTIWSRRLKPFWRMLQPCRRQTNWARFSWASALLSSCTLSLLPPQPHRQAVGVSSAKVSPDLSAQFEQVHTGAEKILTFRKSSQRAKGCHISWKWSLPLQPEKLKLVEKEFPIQFKLLAEQSWSSTNMLLVSAPHFTHAAFSSLRWTPDAQKSSRWTSWPAGRTGRCWCPGSFWPSTKDSASIEICWNQNGRPVIGISSGKLNQSGGLAIANIGYDPHYVPASNYLCHV